MTPLKTFLALLFSCQALGVLAQATPDGLWKTIDDNTRKEKSLVRITTLPGNVLAGRIEKLLGSRYAQDVICEPCTDERKGQPVVGMLILRQLRPDESGSGWWEGGDVLDPENGKTYRARLRVIDNGRQLELRGYLGPFYRSQIWLRVE